MYFGKRKLFMFYPKYIILSKYCFTKIYNFIVFPILLVVYLLQSLLSNYTVFLLKINFFLNVFFIFSKINSDFKIFTKIIQTLFNFTHN
jgi:hypothetical protein